MIFWLLFYLSSSLSLKFLRWLDYIHSLHFLNSHPLLTRSNLASSCQITERVSVKITSAEVQSSLFMVVDICLSCLWPWWLFMPWDILYSLGFQDSMVSLFSLFSDFSFFRRLFFPYICLKHWSFQCFILQSFILDPLPFVLYSLALGEFTHFHHPEQPPFMLMAPKSTLSKSKISLASYPKYLTGYPHLDTQCHFKFNMLQIKFIISPTSQTYCFFYYSHVS